MQVKPHKLPLTGSSLMYTSPPTRVLDKPLRPVGPQSLCDGAKLGRGRGKTPEASDFRHGGNAMRFLVLLFDLLPASVFAADTLDIYWIDVEGGAATLIVTPGGEYGPDGRRLAGVRRARHEAHQERSYDARRKRARSTTSSRRTSIGTTRAACLSSPRRLPITKFVDHGSTASNKTAPTARNCGKATCPWLRASACKSSRATNFR